MVEAYLREVETFAAEDLAAAGHTVEEAPFPYPLNSVPAPSTWTALTASTSPITTRPG